MYAIKCTSCILEGLFLIQYTMTANEDINYLILQKLMENYICLVHQGLGTNDTAEGCQASHSKITKKGEKNKIQFIIN